ncbi:MAG: hypothetical protein M1823_000772 [Watsoniomyces obsoletus]|nr:MAG: hypothetical protein M1823_000772 [Watsoniomyces obsoletus]
MDHQYPPKPVYDPVDARQPWRPGVWTRIPWLGFLALIGVLLGISASIVVLVISNGDPITAWKVQPTVYLAIASTITNVLLHFALTEGVTIAWWTQAMKPGITVNDLHRRWDYGNSLWAATISGKHFNRVALASILVALAPINGPLLQRASTVTTRARVAPVMLSLPIVRELPHGYTGMISGRARRTALLSAPFANTVKAYTNRSDIDMKTTGCEGDCSTTIQGAGFAVNCSSYTEPFALTPVVDRDRPFNPGQQAVVNGTSVFMTAFLWSDSQPGTLRLNVQYKSEADCDGRLTVRNCTLRAATVAYPVLVNGNRSTICLAKEASAEPDAVQQLSEVLSRNTIGSTTLGGLWLALNNRFASTAHLRFAGAVSFELSTTGSTANEYAQFRPDDPSAGSNCTLRFSDPTADLLESARELMFRAALAAANTSHAQRVEAMQTTSRPVYQSHVLFLALATVASVLGVVVVIPTFYGYWILGRTVSMSPVETAKAFNAPLLRSMDSNAEVQHLLKEVGSRPARYGMISITDGKAITNDVALPYDHPLEQRLEMASQDYVRPPNTGGRYTG